jgi:hypothetical protein
MAINFDTTRTYLQEFNFAHLFIEILGWSNAKGIKAIELNVENVGYKATPISQLGGIVVFEMTAENGALPNNAKVRAAVHKEISKLHHENLIIFLDKARTQSLWYCVKREDKRTFPRDHLYVKGQPGDLFLGKLSSMVVDIAELDENGDINVLEAVRRLQKALDIKKVTKQFYTDFDVRRLEFTELIQGIDDDHDRRWYASVLLNRLMFIYFLQRKGFVNNRDLEYLQKKLEESKKRGKDKYYSEFLSALFFEGFAKPEEKRSEKAKNMLGRIRYLNGGLFLPHSIELNGKYKISIPDQAFENILRLFASYSWNLNDTPGGADNEINPDVLGYIFEKYINQKAFGAYYTRTEITEHLCERTINRVILQKVNTPGLAGVLAERKFENIADLLTHLDASLCKQLLFDVLPKLSLLDPACGSGAFLVAAMRTLINVYSAIIGRIEFLNDKALNDWLKKTQGEHPSIGYFIKRRIITDNLFGVDIMEEATEIARLRLFLALVASVRSEDELEPLPNIDFNILPGNSLIGMLRVDEDAFNKKLAGGEQLKMFQQKTYRQIVNEKKTALDAYRHASSLTEDLQALRDDLQTRRCDHYEHLNDLLLDEFTSLKIKYEQATWDENKKEEGKPKKRAVQIQDVQALEPFHWGYEFDEVMNERGGFDVIISNPPWDIFKPNAKEFFAEHSDLVTKKKMTLRDFEEEQDKLLSQKDIREAWFEYLNSFPYVSTYYRSAPKFINQISIVNGKKAGTDINLYKLFVEQCSNLLRPLGGCGMVIPSGIYTDLGTKQLREMLFGSTLITGLFCFENRKEIFENVDSRFKFVILTFEKGHKTREFPARFMRHEVQELATFPSQNNLMIRVEEVRKLAPDSLSIPEIKNEIDAQITTKMSHFPLLGEEIENKWGARFSTEFHITNDSKYFNEKKKGLPLYQGRIIWQFTANYAEPKFWIKPELVEKKYATKKDNIEEYNKYRLAFRGVAASTNERTLISTMLPKGVFAEVQIPVIDVRQGSINLDEQIFLVALFNSFCCDYNIRNRVSMRLSNFHVYQTPIPRLSAKDKTFAPIVERAAKLICTTPEFDDLAKEVGLGSHKKGVTDPKERAKLRAELDGMIAHLYELTESEFAHILSTFPLVVEEVKSAAMEEFRKLAPNPELMMLINAGETDKVEFKVGAFRNPKTGAKDDGMMLNVLQEIAAFMNTNGGTLLIGVKDNGTIQGIEPEYAIANPKKQNWDGYLLNLVDRFRRLGIPNAAQYCIVDKHNLGGRDICQITVQPASEPVHIEDKFFVREGNRKRELSVKEGVDYINKHWKK